MSQTRNVLLLGSGGREHALAWKIQQSPQCGQLVMMPGSDAMADLGTCVDGNILNKSDVLQACQTHHIDLVVIGPEAPLAEGISDVLREEGYLVFGPSKEAARLESSKAYMKDVATKAGVPTASYAHFDDFDAARAYVHTRGVPIVIKADGLAAGKGVTVAMTLDEALQAIDDLEGGIHGKAGHSLVIEEYMTGDEVSLFVLCSGLHFCALGSAQDHKRLRDGDQGPNTGGMGAYSPAPMFTKELHDQSISRIVEPVLKEMVKRGTPYEGVLFCGLMLTQDGPKLVEFNARFGDPECQVLMTRFQGDLVALLYALAQGSLPKGDHFMKEDLHAMTVVMAAPGYPEAPKKGSVIHLDEQKSPHVTIFHAGTKKNDDGTMWPMVAGS